MPLTLGLHYEGHGTRGEGINAKSPKQIIMSLTIAQLSGTIDYLSSSWFIDKLSPNNVSFQLKKKSVIFSWEGKYKREFNLILF